MKEELETTASTTTRRYPKCVREEILSWAREGKNWSQRAKELGIRHQSAYYWVASAHKRPFQNSKPKATLKRSRERSAQSQVNSKVVEFVCSLYEADPKITLAQICLRLRGEMAVTVAQSTAHKYLRGMVFTRSRLPPPDYSSLEAKEETREYISAISNYMQEGREIIWLGGTIFNLHTRKSVSRLQELHIHSLAAISSSLGLLHASFKRGPYSRDDQEAWIHQHLQPQLLTNAVLVSDAFETGDTKSFVPTTTFVAPKRLRLAPLHTDRLNPCEAYWAMVTERVKARLLSGEAHLPAGSTTDENQRLRYLERLLTDAMATVAFSTGKSEGEMEGEYVCEKAVRDSTACLTDVLQLVTGLKVERS